jgi:dihydropteroate synthase
MDHGPGTSTLRLGPLEVGPLDQGVMAIVNRTPDSFFDQGAYLDDAAAMAAVDAAVEQGAALVDLGGVKAGPGAEVDDVIDRLLDELDRRDARIAELEAPASSGDDEVRDDRRDADQDA